MTAAVASLSLQAQIQELKADIEEVKKKYQVEVARKEELLVLLSPDLRRDDEVVGSSGSSEEKKPGKKQQTEQEAQEEPPAKSKLFSSGSSTTTTRDTNHNKEDERLFSSGSSALTKRELPTTTTTTTTNREKKEKGKDKDKKLGRVSSKVQDELASSNSKTAVQQDFSSWTAKALSTHKGSTKGELSFAKGATITILEENDAEGLFKGRIGKKEGWFPSFYVSR